MLLTMPFVSAVFALTAQRQIAAQPPAGTPFDHLFFRGMLYFLLICMPVAGYFYYGHSAWSLAYLIDPTRLPVTFGLVLASLLFSGYFFFYLGVYAVIRAHRPRTALLASLQLLLASILFLLIFRDELTTTGPYHAFHTGTAESLRWGGGLGEALTGMLLLAIPAAGIILKNLREDTAFPSLEPEDSQW